MTEQTSSCDHERLRMLLANELPPEIEPEITEHVATCQSCRKQLESLAGNQDWWTELQTCFGENAGLIISNGATSSSPDSRISHPENDDETFAADFAVDFLEPCGRSETLGRLSDIEILEVIGCGGMGIVLKGYQRELGRYVAVKVMAPHLAASGSARKRFAREGRAAAAIVHPHVIAIHSVNASSRLPYDTNRNRRIDVDETDNPPVGVAEITILTFIEFDEDFDEQLTQAELAKFLSTQRYKKNVINKSKE